MIAMLNIEQKKAIISDIKAGYFWQKRKLGTDIWTVVSVDETILDSYEYRRLDLYCVVEDVEGNLEIRTWNASMDPRSYVYRGPKANCEIFVESKKPTKFWLVEQLKALPDDKEREHFVNVVFAVKQAIVSKLNRKHQSAFNSGYLVKDLFSELGIDEDIVNTEFDKLYQNQRKAEKLEATSKRDLYN